MTENAAQVLRPALNLAESVSFVFLSPTGPPPEDPGAPPAL